MREDRYRCPQTIFYSILDAMNYFGKLTEAYTITNQKASTAVRVLVDNLVCRLEVPLELCLGYLKRKW